MKKFSATIFYCITIAMLGCLMVSLAIVFWPKQYIIVSNTITGEIRQIKIKNGQTYADILSEESAEDCTFVGYYSDQSLSCPAQMSQKAVSGKVLYAAFIKNINCIENVDFSAFGVKYTGDLSSQNYNLLAENFAYLDLSTANISSVSFEANSKVKTLILPQTMDTLEGLNNYSLLENFDAGGVKTISDSLNNCQKLSSVNLREATTIIGSFCCGGTIKNVVLPESLESLEGSFYKTNIEKIENNSESYSVIDGILYNSKNENNYKLIKASASAIVSSIDPRTTTIESYAFYSLDNAYSLEISAPVTLVDSFAFAYSGISKINFSSGAGLTVGDNAFYGATKLENVNLGLGLTRICNKAFYGCSALENISADSQFLSSIGEYAFYGCALKKLTFGDQSITLGEGVFANCTKLSSIKINTNSFLDNEFYNCTTLTEISGNVLSNLQNIGNYAFYNCTSLSNIRFAQNAQSLGSGAFYGCKNIVDSVYFSNLSTINALAFYNCKQIETISISGNIDNFDSSIFEACENLKNISISGSGVFSSDGVIYSTDSKKLLYYPLAKTDTHITITSSVESVDTSLAANTYLQKIETSSASFYCEDGVLYSADQKTLLIYPAGKQNSSFIIPSFVQTVSAKAFTKVQYLTKLEVSSSVQTQEHGFLYQNLALKELSLYFIGKTTAQTETAFLGYIFGADTPEGNAEVVPSSLKTISVLSSGQLCTGAFEYCKNLVNITLGGQQKIESNLFYGCASLQTIKIDGSVEQFGSYAFYLCKSLINISWGYFDYTQLMLSANCLEGIASSLRITLSFDEEKPQNADIVEYKKMFMKIGSISSWVWIT